MPVVLAISIATTAAAESMSLREAVNTALERNFLVQAARFEHNAAASRVSAVGSRYLPRIFFEERAAVTNSATRSFMMRLDQGRFSLAGDLNHPDAVSDFQSSVVFEQPLFDMNIGSAVSAAREEKTARERSLEWRMDLVAFQVYEAYLGVQRAAAQLGVAEQALGATREHIRLAAVRSAAGVGLKYDELRIRTYQAEVEQQKITAENDYHMARLRLGKVMGLDSGSMPDISEPLTALEVGITLTDLEKAAFESRKDIDAQKAEVARGDAVVAAARSGYWPTVYGTVSYQANDRDIPLGRDNDSWLVGATLRWELFDGMRRMNEVQAAQAGRNAASSYLRNLQQDVAFEVREAVARREEAAKRLEVARKGLQETEEMVRLISRRFENALSTTVELLDAETALTRARAQLADNEANLALATAKVYHGSGLFRKEVVK
jgi:outer membrane protein TolC